MKFKKTNYEMFYLVDDDLTPIGCVGYALENGWADIGMLMASKKSPKGTAVELINRIELEIKDASKYRIGILPDNIAMEKSLLKCGYKKIKDGRFEKINESSIY